MKINLMIIMILSLLVATMGCGKKTTPIAVSASEALPTSLQFEQPEGVR